MSRVVFYAGVIILAVCAGTAGYIFRQQQLLHMESEQQVTSLLKGDTIAALNEQQNYNLKGKPRPDFTLPDVTGQQHDISEWDGQVVALNFWATWCPPCLKEIPAFIALQKKYADQGLQFIGIALQRPEEVVDFMQEQAMNYPVLAGELEVADLARTYGNDIGALPYTVIIDREGRIAFVKHGELSGEVAEEVIVKLL